MKIQKAVFSSSAEFSVCWNLISKIYRTKLDIEPICLLFGHNPDLSTEYGPVIQMPVFPEFPLLIQITWSKFYFPLCEPDTTWMVGDIDLFPLQTDWYTKQLEAVPDDHYVHLDADGIAQLSGTPYTWTGRGELHAGNTPNRIQHETNLPGHYHVGKGSTFNKLRLCPGTFLDELGHIVSGPQYHNTRAFRASDPIDQANLWCAEERRSTEMVRHAVLDKRIKFTGFSIKNTEADMARSTGKRIDRSTLRNEAEPIMDTEAWRESYRGKDYVYDAERLRQRDYVDVHCARPFQFFMPQTLNLLATAGMI